MSLIVNGFEPLIEPPAGQTRLLGQLFGTCAGSAAKPELVIVIVPIGYSPLMFADRSARVTVA